MLALGENGETGKFLWSLYLLIRPEWYPDSYINTCFSDLKRWKRPYPYLEPGYLKVSIIKTKQQPIKYNVIIHAPYQLPFSSI